MREVERQHDDHELGVHGDHEFAVGRFNAFIVPGSDDAIAGGQRHALSGNASGAVVFGDDVHAEGQTGLELFLTLFDAADAAAIEDTPMFEVILRFGRSFIPRGVPFISLRIAKHSALPADYRVVLDLHDLDERPVKDVAEHLSRREGAVYMLVARAIDHGRQRSAYGNLLESTGRFHYN